MGRALSSAALLHEAGVDVEILVRRNHVHFLGLKDRLRSYPAVSRALFSPTDVGPAGISRLVAVPDTLKRLPRSILDRLRRISIRPAGARWLHERLRDVPITVNTAVASAVHSHGKLRLILSDNTIRLVDHALLGTGYRVNVSRYSFLSPRLLDQLQLADGFPRLGPAFESSVPGLHFLGAPAAWSYGPLMYFVSGTKYAASVLLRHFSRSTKVGA